MKPIVLPSYSGLQQALNDTTLKLHLSQVHGLICGILCGSLDSKTEWESLVTGAKEPNETHAILHELYTISNQQLKDFSFEGQLLLPPDEEALPLRAEALTLYCQGFLTGLKLVQIPIEHRQPSDLTEAINDLVEIAKMNYEHVVASEEDEIAYVELVEYVRMAVIFIYQESHKAEEGMQQQGDTLH